MAKFFGAGGFAGVNTFGDEESVGGNTQCRVMMEASPTSPFIVTQPQFLFQVLIVPLDARAHVRFGHQVVQRDVVRQRRQVVFERIGIAGRPFDQQPLLGVQAACLCFPPAVAHPDGGKAQLSISLVPWRQLMVWKALAGSACAKSLTDTG